MAKTAIQRYAQLGAATRAQAIRTELAEIERTFPGITRRRPGRPRSTDGADLRPAERPRRKRKPMTAAQKKAVGERMRKYWAARRKAEVTKG